MCSGVMLAETVGLVEGTLVPQNVESPLLDSVVHPAESHAHCLGPFLFGGMVGNAISRIVVSLDGGRGLWVAHLFERCLDGTGFFAIVEEGAKFSLSRAGDNLVHDGTKGIDRSAERWGFSLKFVWVGAVAMATSCP
jgi:hypothetical protein